MSSSSAALSWNQKLYNWFLSKANEPSAMWVMAGISFAESSFFPLPPDLLIVPLVIADRSKAWKIAAIGTVTSVLGGIVGYAIGCFLYETLGLWVIHTYQLQGAFAQFQTDFIAWGFWIIVLKGLTPIPFKLVTIASGLFGLDLPTFLIASTIARGFRFYLLSGLLWYFGPWFKTVLEKYFGWFLLLTAVTLICGVMIVKFLF